MSLYVEKTFLPNSSESVTLQAQTRPRVTDVIPKSVCFFGSRLFRAGNFPSLSTTTDSALLHFGIREKPGCEPARVQTGTALVS